MKPIIAIDPGTTQSALLTFAKDRIEIHGIMSNEVALYYLKDLRAGDSWDDTYFLLAVEQVGHYGTGMPVGREVFETCVWAGRFIQSLQPCEFVQVQRQTIKTHLCGTPRAKDPNIRQALIDRFGPPGTKKSPGLLYGIKSHLWAALALAVYVRDTQSNFGTGTRTGRRHDWTRNS